MEAILKGFSLRPEEFALLQELEVGHPDAFRHVYENGRRLLDFGLVIPARRGSIKLSDTGKGALLRARCVSALRAKLAGEDALLQPVERKWLEANRFLSSEGSVLPHGRLWLQSFEQEDSLQAAELDSAHFKKRSA